MTTKSQEQADFMEHAAHDAAYAASHNIKSGVAQGFNRDDIVAEAWGKSRDGQCAKLLNVYGEDEPRRCEFRGPRPWADRPPEPPPIDDEDLP